MMTPAEAQRIIIGDLARHLRLNAQFIQEPAIAEEAKAMLGRLERNEPLATKPADQPSAPAQV